MREPPDSGTHDASQPAAELSFETALERLEGIVGRLEGGELELEDALAAFEQGVALTRRCAEQLESTERRIQVLVREGEALATRAFEPEADDPEDE